jgi:hypothetical protein
VARNKTLKTIIAATTLALVVAGCSTTSGNDPVVEATPHITLSAPPTLTAKGTAAVVIDSFGHNGEQIKLYPFTVGFDEPANCTSTTVTPLTVTLTGGPQTVALNPFQTGVDVYWVLSGTGFTTECGAATTRVLAVPNIFIQEFSSSAGAVIVIGQTTATITLAEVETYQLTVHNVPAPLKGQTISATVSWIGPFKTSPEAQAVPCPTTPEAVQDTFTFDMSIAGTSQSGELGISSGSLIPVNSPGIYRLLVSMEGTDYSAAITPVCESALLVTAQ